VTKEENILVTGAAGFIGFHLCRLLCAKGFKVTGIDNLNEYYDVNLKKNRLTALENHSGFRFERLDLTDKDGMTALFDHGGFKYVVNLAAQAGVRHSLTNPHDYIDSNLHGFLNILEGCRYSRVSHLLYASSGAVYGANKKMPFSTKDRVDHPLSLYGASKRSNELMAHSYSSLFGVPTTGLRFFSAYGPFGRPDMALFIFTKRILEGTPIDLYNNGQMKRDFTYVGDLVESIYRLITHIPAGDKDFDASDPSSSFAPYRLYNIGSNHPVELIDFVRILEEKLGRKAKLNYLPMQAGDVPSSHADTQELQNEIGFNPSTPIEIGIGHFVDWYLSYYHK
jgi:UDP-glucuronate 4-epimerase